MNELERYTLARVERSLFLVDEDETMNGSYRNNVVERRCLPLGFFPQWAVALTSRALAHATT